MTTNAHSQWIRETAKAIRSGTFDPATVTEDWQRRALYRATPTDGSEMCEAYPAKLEEYADEMDATQEDQEDC